MATPNIPEFYAQSINREGCALWAQPAEENLISNEFIDALNKARATIDGDVFITISALPTTEVVICKPCIDNVSQDIKEIDMTEILVKEGRI